MAKRRSRKRGLGSTSEQHAKSAARLLERSSDVAREAVQATKNDRCRTAVGLLGEARELYGRFLEAADGEADSATARSAAGDGGPRNVEERWGSGRLSKQLDFTESEIKKRCMREDY